MLIARGLVLKNARRENVYFMSIFLLKWKLKSECGQALIFARSNHHPFFGGDELRRGIRRQPALAEHIALVL
jgi:hypothetical protein